MGKIKASLRSRGIPKLPEFRYFLNEDPVTAIVVRNNQFAVYYREDRSICTDPSIKKNISPDVSEDPNHREDYHANFSIEKEINHRHIRFNKTPSELKKALDGLRKCNRRGEMTNEKLLTDTTTADIANEYQKFKEKIKKGEVFVRGYEASNLDRYRHNPVNFPSLFRHSNCIEKTGASCILDKVRQKSLAHNSENNVSLSLSLSNGLIGGAVLLAGAALYKLNFFGLCRKRNYYSYNEANDGQKLRR